jgi:hypothetical protein
VPSLFGVPERRISPGDSLNVKRAFKRRAPVG